MARRLWPEAARAFMPHRRMAIVAVGAKVADARSRATV
jgi:hypothetical protein